MSACRGCGGVLGRDCWNEQDCMWISADMAARARNPQQPEPCQGCSEVTGGMRECIGVCVGLTSWDDVRARATAWTAMLATVATTNAAARAAQPDADGAIERVKELRDQLCDCGDDGCTDTAYRDAITAALDGA